MTSTDRMEGNAMGVAKTVMADLIFSFHAEAAKGVPWEEIEVRRDLIVSIDPVMARAAEIAGCELHRCGFISCRTQNPGPCGGHETLSIRWVNPLREPLENEKRRSKAMNEAARLAGGIARIAIEEARLAAEAETKIRANPLVRLLTWIGAIR